jgi:hypothetical protein
MSKTIDINSMIRINSSPIWHNQIEKSTEHNQFKLGGHLNRARGASLAAELGSKNSSV